MKNGELVFKPRAVAAGFGFNKRDICLLDIVYVSQKNISSCNTDSYYRHCEWNGEDNWYSI